MLLAIDPGREKCGWALMEGDGNVKARGIWRRDEVTRNLGQLAAEYSIDSIVMGDGTGHRGLLQELRQSPVWRERLHLVAETRSSEEARLLYVREHAAGWRRFIPASLQYPDRPYDDYVAVILGRRYLSAGRDRPPTIRAGNHLEERTDGRRTN